MTKRLNNNNSENERENSASLCIFLPHLSIISLVVVIVETLSHVLLFATPWTVPVRLLCLWDFPGKNTAVGSFSNNLLWNRNHDIFTLMPLPSFYPQWSTVPGIQSSLNKDHGTGLSGKVAHSFCKGPFVHSHGNWHVLGTQ